MANGLEEAERRVGYYRRARDQAANDLKQAEVTLRSATSILESAQMALDAAEDVYAAAARGVARAPRQIKAETRALLRSLLDRNLTIFGKVEIAALFEEHGLSLTDVAIRQWLKRVADDGFLLRLSRGNYGLNRDMTAALLDDAKGADGRSGHTVASNVYSRSVNGDHADAVGPQDGGAADDCDGQDEPDGNDENPITSWDEKAGPPEKSDDDANQVTGVRATRYDRDYLDDDPPF